MIKTITEGLNEVKAKFNLTNRTWAEISEVAEGTINNILSGRVANPSPETIDKMIRPLGLTWNDIFGEPKTPTAIQSATIDHYTMLIESLKDQISGYKEQLTARDAAHKQQIDDYKSLIKSKDESHKEQICTYRKFVWALFAVAAVMMLFLGFLCIDMLHGDWGIFRG